MDFFGVPGNRLAILQREAGRCFYCQRAVSQANYVIEHVVSRPEGSGNYRNIVAACRECNNRKGSTAADDFLRDLYRSGLLNSNELQARIEALGRLRAGELKPAIDESETTGQGFTV